jgi:ABC-type taurine transport system substrate-binding protein
MAVPKDPEIVAARARDAAAATAEYKAKAEAVRANTERLRQLRLAKEAAAKQADCETPARPSKRRR